MVDFLKTQGKKKALVTGGAGFIGSNVVRLLLGKSYTVVVLDNLSTGYRENLAEFSGVKFIEGDVRDAETLDEAMEGVDIIFHLAASVGNVKSLENPIFDLDVNVLGTLQLLETARKKGIKKIVYSSSAAILGEPKGLPIDEDHPVQPDSPYGVSKLAGEKYCICYSKLYNDINVVCLRYFNVYGRNQRYDAYGNVIPIFVTRLLMKESLIIYGDGEQTRDFVNVRDVAWANLLAAEALGGCGVFNIGSGTSITINQLATMIQDAAEIQVKIEYKPPRKGEVRHSFADISAAQRILGYKPEVSITKGLREYMSWIRSDMVKRR